MPQSGSPQSALALYVYICVCVCFSLCVCVCYERGGAVHDLCFSRPVLQSHFYLQMSVQSKFTIYDVSFLFILCFFLAFLSFSLLCISLLLCCPLQFFLIIMLIFAAEVAALVFGFIYQGKVSHTHVFSVIQCFLLIADCIGDMTVFDGFHHYVFCLSVQISGDLERTMTDVFSKYDGKDPETSTVDFLQHQVCVSSKNYK